MFFVIQPRKHISRHEIDNFCSKLIFASFAGQFVLELLQERCVCSDAARAVDSGGNEKAKNRRQEFCMVSDRRYFCG